MTSAKVIQNCVSGVEGGPRPIDSFRLRDGSGHMDHPVLASIGCDEGHDGGHVRGHCRSLHKVEARLALVVHTTSSMLLLVWLGGASTGGRSSGSKGAAVLGTRSLLQLLATRSH